MNNEFQHFFLLNKRSKICSSYYVTKAHTQKKIPKKKKKTTQNSLYYIHVQGQFDEVHNNSFSGEHKEKLWTKISCCICAPVYYYNAKGSSHLTHSHKKNITLLDLFR